MARPQGTCTIAAANVILDGLAIIDKIECDGGIELYRATLNNGEILKYKSNTKLVIMVIDYAIENGLQRILQD